MATSHPYDDILHLPHHVSQTHPQMPLAERAAQFSPFAALSGYEEAVAETARPTEQRRILSEEQEQQLGRLLHELRDEQRSGPAVALRYFEPDARKAGGAYREAEGRVRRVDELRGLLELHGGLSVPFGDILSLERLPASPPEREP